MLLAFGAPLAAETIVMDDSAAACLQEISDTRVTLSHSEISFYEFACQITDSRAAALGGQSLTLACYGGGEEWADSLDIVQTDQGYRMTGDQQASVDYVRCP